jgi:hypothetical protein
MKYRGRGNLCDNEVKILRDASVDKASKEN